MPVTPGGERQQGCHGGGGQGQVMAAAEQLGGEPDTGGSAGAEIEEIPQRGATSVREFGKRTRMRAARPWRRFPSPVPRHACFSGLWNPMEASGTAPANQGSGAERKCRAQ